MKKAINTATGRVESAASYSKDHRPEYEYQCPAEGCAKTVTWACGATSLKSSPHFRHLPGEGKGCPGNDEIDIETKPGTVRGDAPVAENRGTEVHTVFHDYLEQQPAKKLVADSPEADAVTGPMGKHHSIDPTKTPGNRHREYLRRHLIALTRDPEAYRGSAVFIDEPGFEKRHEMGEDVFIPFSDIRPEHIGRRIYVYGPVCNIRPFRPEGMDHDGYYINTTRYPDSFSVWFTDPQALTYFEQFNIITGQLTPDLHAIAYGTVSTKADKTTPKMTITDHKKIAFLHAPKDTH